MNLWSVNRKSDALTIAQIQFHKLTRANEISRVTVKDAYKNNSRQSPGRKTTISKLTRIHVTYDSEIEGTVTGTTSAE